MIKNLHKIFCLVIMACIFTIINGQTFRVIELKNNSGTVVVDVYNSCDGFPMETQKAIKRFIFPIKDMEVTFNLNDIPEGNYALVLFHDENNNKLLDVNMLHIPKEGVCTSNNAMGFMSPPKFEDAVFLLSNKLKSQTLNMIYLNRK